jgi:hypothetical protein
MAKVLIVGGGVIGTMHAYLALKAGHLVVQCERDAIAQSASVRNFGLIWVSGREKGTELELALRSRVLWEEIGNEIGTIGFRPNGSLTVATDEKVWKLVNDAANMPDADARGFELLTKEELQKLEPALAGNYFGALRCTQDAAVEPNLLFIGFREYLLKNPNYKWVPNFEVVEASHSDTGNHVLNSKGEKISGDYLIICAGAMHAGFLSDHLTSAPIRKVHLQMAATEPQKYKVGHSLADGDSLRYYPAFKDLDLASLNPQSEIASKYHMQLLLVQRLDGPMTIGDTHEYVEPFTHEIDEAPYDHLLDVIQGIFGGAKPRIQKRWSGVYSQSTSKDIYFRKEIAPQTVVVTGGGGRGNTLSAAIAEETFKSWQI